MEADPFFVSRGNPRTGGVGRGVGIPETGAAYPLRLNPPAALQSLLRPASAVSSRRPSVRPLSGLSPLWSRPSGPSEAGLRRAGRLRDIGCFVDQLHERQGGAGRVGFSGDGSGPIDQEGRKRRRDATRDAMGGRCRPPKTPGTHDPACALYLNPPPDRAGTAPERAEREPTKRGRPGGLGAGRVTLSALFGGLV